MKLMRDFPVLRLSSDSDDKTTAARFSDARTVEMKDAVQAARDLAAHSGSGSVLLIEPHVVPSRTAEAITIERVLCDSRVPILYPARSVVTGLHLPRGLVLMPVSAFKDEFPRPTLTAPHAIGRYTGNGTPELAFETGFTIATGRTATSPSSANRFALSASLGTDALNGCWWVLGTLTGLLGRETLGDAWARHEVLLSKPRDIQRHIAGEARRVRLESGLPVQALSQDQSRVMKAMLPDWPAEDIWQDFITVCRTLGSEGDALADRYQRAVRYIWPGAA